MKQKSIDTNVTNILSKDFPGSLYRYPGGTVSNRFNWETSIGPRHSRSKQRPVNWRDPLVAEFGYVEYINFLNKVKGKPWVVTNLYGSLLNELDEATLSKKATAWAEFSTKLSPNVYRWELGNELDRGKYKWSSAKYSKRAMRISQSIETSIADPSFVAMLRDFEVDGPGSADSYNLDLIKRTAGLGFEYSLHQYYDGPSVRNRLEYACSTIDTIKRFNNGNASVWITEHAYAPGSILKNWKTDYIKTSNLQSAISVADYIIGTTQIPEVKGAFIHSLSKDNGPWAMFHKSNNHIKPSVVYWSLKILRENLLSDVLDVDIFSRNNSKYIGGYDFRASVLTDKNRSKFNYLMVNRSSDNIKITVVHPKLANRTIKATATFLQHNNLEINNYDEKQNITPETREYIFDFDSTGKANITLDAHSVTSFLFNI